MQIPVAVGLVVALGLAGGQEIGRPLVEEVELRDFANVAAESWEQLAGRAVLIEFFAHW